MSLGLKRLIAQFVLGGSTEGFFWAGCVWFWFWFWFGILHNTDKEDSRNVTQEKNEI